MLGFGSVINKRVRDSLLQQHHLAGQSRSSSACRNRSPERPLARPHREEKRIPPQHGRLRLRMYLVTTAFRLTVDSSSVFSRRARSREFTLFSTGSVNWNGRPSEHLRQTSAVGPHVDSGWRAEGGKTRRRVASDNPSSRPHRQTLPHSTPTPGDTPASTVKTVRKRSIMEYNLLF
jgi:hypothetical protein